MAINEKRKNREAQHDEKDSGRTYFYSQVFGKRSGLAENGPKMQK